MSVSYLSIVVGLPGGLAGSAVVTPKSTAGGQPAAVVGATAGTVWESADEPGAYGCPVTYPSPLMPGARPFVAWSFSGGASPIVDADPKPLQLDDVATVAAAVAIDGSRALGTPRDLTSVPDDGLTVDDALHCAVASAVGQVDDSAGTQLVVSTPSGTVLRTFTVTLDADGVAVARS